MQIDVKKLVTTVQSAGKRVSDKALYAMDVTKLKLERGRVLAALDKAYRRLGIYAFEQERNGLVDDGYESCIYSIDALRVKLENYDAQIAELARK